MLDSEDTCCGQSAPVGRDEAHEMPTGSRGRPCQLSKPIPLAQLGTSWTCFLTETQEPLSDWFQRGLKMVEPLWCSQKETHFLSTHSFMNHSYRIPTLSSFSSYHRTPLKPTVLGDRRASTYFWGDRSPFWGTQGTEIS